MPRRCHLSPAVLCLVAGALATPLSAASWEDARLAYVFSAADVEADLPGGGVDDGWDDYTHLQIDLLRAMGDGYGQVTGVSGLYRSGELEGRNERFEHETLGLRVFGGLGLFPLDSMLIEITPFAGVGYGQAELKRAGGGLDDDNFFWEFGGSAQVSYAFDDTFVVGGGMHYTFGTYEYDLAGDREIEETGLSFGLFLGIRLE